MARCTELQRAQQKLGMLTRQWQDDRISDGLYFANVERLEGRIRELTNERNRHAAVAQRAVADVADVSRRWFTPVGDGGLDLSEKRAYVREALHAVIISPAGKESAATASSIPPPAARMAYLTHSIGARPSGGTASRCWQPSDFQELG